VKKEYFYSIPASPKVSRSIRDVVENIFKKTSLSARDANRLTLVFAEVFMNAIMYGSDDSGIIDIAIHIDDREISATVSDRGKSGKKIMAEDLEKIIKLKGANTSLSKTSGRGLSEITKKCTDHFAVGQNKYGGITVSFVKMFKNKQKQNNENY